MSDSDPPKSPTKGSSFPSESSSKSKFKPQGSRPTAAKVKAKNAGHHGHGTQNLHHHHHLHHQKEKENERRPTVPLKSTQSNKRFSVVGEKGQDFSGYYSVYPVGSALSPAGSSDAIKGSFGSDDSGLAAPSSGIKPTIMRSISAIKSASRSKISSGSKKLRSTTGKISSKSKGSKNEHHRKRSSGVGRKKSRSRSKDHKKKVSQLRGIETFGSEGPSTMVTISSPSDNAAGSSSSALSSVQNSAFSSKIASSGNLQAISSSVSSTGPQSSVSKSNSEHHRPSSGPKKSVVSPKKSGHSKNKSKGSKGSKSKGSKGHEKKRPIGSKVSKFPQPGPAGSTASEVPKMGKSLKSIGHHPSTTGHIVPKMAHHKPNAKTSTGGSKINKK